MFTSGGPAHTHYRINRQEQRLKDKNCQKLPVPSNKESGREEGECRSQRRRSHAAEQAGLASRVAPLRVAGGARTEACSSLPTTVLISERLSQNGPVQPDSK